MRPAALNLLTINIFPAGESADFADSLSGNHLTVCYLAAALVCPTHDNCHFERRHKLLGVPGLPKTYRPGTPTTLSQRFSGQGLILYLGPCPHFGLPGTSNGQGPNHEIRPCPSEGNGLRLQGGCDGARAMARDWGDAKGAARDGGEARQAARAEGEGAGRGTAAGRDAGDCSAHTSKQNS